MILVNQPLFLGNEKKYLNQCIDSGWISSDGPFVKEFEDKFASFLGVKHAISVCNGTVAIELALGALDLKEGDEVILPSHTIISCVLGVIRRGLVPVLVDVDPHTWTIDVNQIENKITSKTRAIMPVHMFGHPCDMDPILSIAEKYNLKVVEDAAEAHGALYRNKYCGAIGDVATFSFYANKIITTGEGGMVVTNDDNIAARARSLRNLCFLPHQRFLHEELGYNFRFTNLQAAVGCAQMETIDRFLDIKLKQGKFYTERLKSVPSITLQHVEPWARHVYWVFGFTLVDDFPIDAFQLAKVLLERGVQTRPFFWPIHEQPVLRRMGLFKSEEYPVSSKIARRGLYLPSGMALTLDEQAKVCDILCEVLSNY